MPIINGVEVEGCIYYEAKNDKGKWCDLTCTKENAPAFRCENMDNCYYKQLQRVKAELKKFQDMAEKGLEEFKDVGGCWGCGIQLACDEYFAECKKLRAENEKLREVLEIWKYSDVQHTFEITKYKQTLKEIKEYKM